ncbi:MAG: tetratricopeptide repeat protein [Vicinamibacterales bacterium]
MPVAATLVVVFVLLASSCAPKAALPPVVSPAFPGFVFPAVPPGLGPPQAVELHQRAWRSLQAGDFRNAEREFSAALKRARSFYPAEAGLGYVNLAQRQYREALQHFERGLAADARYVAALAGRGEALLGLERPADAMASFEAALAADPSLTFLRDRLDVLALRAVQDNLAAARRAADQGRYDEARAAYQRAIAGSPESAFLYRDLAEIEMKQGRTSEALAHLRQAVSLDPGDQSSWARIGETLEAQGDYDGAADAYSRAAAIDPGGNSAERAKAARNKAELSRLPAEFRAIPESAAITRGDLAALLGVRFEPILGAAPERPAFVVTDTRAHWAAHWIQMVIRAGVMDLFPNHTFQPGQRVRRLDLASALARVLTLMTDDRPRMARPWQAERPIMRDLPPRHLGYPAAAMAVSAGLLPLTAEGSFEPSRLVSGQEAVQAVERLEGLARALPRVRSPEEDLR